MSASVEQDIETAEVDSGARTNKKLVADYSAAQSLTNFVPNAIALSAVLVGAAKLVWEGSRMAIVSIRLRLKSRHQG